MNQNRSDQDREAQIRQKAYDLWVAEGKPTGPPATGRWPRSIWATRCPSNARKSLTTRASTPLAAKRNGKAYCNRRGGSSCILLVAQRHTNLGITFPFNKLQPVQRLVRTLLAAMRVGPRVFWPHLFLPLPDAPRTERLPR